jgi:PAS domain S-box-containing protein
VTFVDVAYYFGRALLVSTVLSAISGVLRRHEAQRVDVALFMSTLLISSLVPNPVPFASAIQLTLVTALPYFVLRLSGHFRQVPRFLTSASAAVPFAFGLGQLVARSVFTTGWMRVWSQAYVGALFLYAAVLMLSEGRRSVGFKAKRLVLASAGTASFSTASLLVTVVAFGDLETRRDWVPVDVYLDAFTLLCYFLAFNTPRSLTTRWRRAEQANYLAQASEREPEERGRRAADDLVDGASRCVGGALTLVALKSPQADRGVVVEAASRRDLVGRLIHRGPGLINRVLATGVAELGRPSDCEPEVAASVAASGVMVLVAPVVADAEPRGVVLVVHRRGALFPQDDLSVLAQLGRNAATALDHAALIVERRDRVRTASERRFREFESRVELMLDSIKDYAMLVLDREGVVAAWHLGAQHVFGHSREEIAGQSGATLFDMPQGEFEAWLHEAATNGFAEREGTCRRFDGHTFAGATTIRPLVPEPGAPPGFAVVTRDVTEQRGLEDRLRQGQKMQAIGQLAGGVAHDFNNLLTAILGYADWLEQDLSGDRRVGQVVEIQRAAERAADLTRRLLAFSRKQMVQPDRINLCRLIADLLPMLRRMIGERIAIVDETAPLTSPVLGDRTQVEQILLNLVLNARDAMPHGGQITIRTGDVWCDGTNTDGAVAGPHVLLEVVDTGVGMDAETRRRAFEPFFTTKDVGRGTGLGLATVYGIVQQMGGSVEVETAPQHGAAFRLYFPHVSAAPLSTSLPEPTSALLGRETVLLVEDDEMLRPYLVQVLECNGYHVIAADSSERALSLIDSSQEPIDLVISDVVMPGRSGPELVAELLRARPGLPALYISGHAEGLLPRPPGPAGRTQLLQKPFSSTDLLTKVRQILAAA